MILIDNIDIICFPNNLLPYRISYVHDRYDILFSLFSYTWHAPSKENVIKTRAMNNKMFVSNVLNLDANFD